MRCQALRRRYLAKYPVASAGEGRSPDPASTAKINDLTFCNSAITEKIQQSRRRPLGKPSESFVVYIRQVFFVRFHDRLLLNDRTVFTRFLVTFRG